MANVSYNFLTNKRFLSIKALYGSLSQRNALQYIFAVTLSMTLNQPAQATNGRLNAQNCHNDNGVAGYHCHKALNQSRRAVSLPTRHKNRPTMKNPTHGLRIRAEQRCTKYDRKQYQPEAFPWHVETSIVQDMGGRIFAPYELRDFNSTSETQIEHIVALSEAHDSGLCNASTATKRRFSRDTINLTLASPAVNKAKSGHDAAMWIPKYNQCWFANKVIQVKKRYNLSLDQAEATALTNILTKCNSTRLEYRLINR